MRTYLWRYGSDWNTVVAPGVQLHSLRVAQCLNLLNTTDRNSLSGREYLQLLEDTSLVPVNANAKDQTVVKDGRTNLKSFKTDENGQSAVQNDLRTTFNYAYDRNDNGRAKLQEMNELAERIWQKIMHHNADIGRSLPMSRRQQLELTKDILPCEE